MRIRNILSLALAVLLLAPGTRGARAQSNDWGDDWGNDGSMPAVEIHGFAEAAGSARLTRDDVVTSDYPLGSARMRLDLAHYADRADVRFKLDFIRDAVLRDDRYDVRQAAVGVRVASWIDLRAGRQVLTWGTGDFLFLNDLFPKDFQSFFTGEDDEFLKAPANAFKLSAYSKVVNLDVVWSPVFEPDRFITGKKLSYFSPMTGTRVGAEAAGAVRPVMPDETLENSEVYVRAYRSVGRAEVALYGYRGYSKEPLAFDNARMRPAFARRNTAGGSIRTNFLGGIANVEGVYYDSEDDREGTNPFVPNSQTRGVVGYEHEITGNATLGVQYYAEWTSDYDSLSAHSPWPAWEPARVRQLATARLSWWRRQQTLLLSAFGFVSPNDGDSHWRISASLKWSDNVTIVTGSNLMFGDRSTFFGQLNNNSNAYFRVRYAF